MPTFRFFVECIRNLCVIIGLLPPIALCFGLPPHCDLRRRSFLTTAAMRSAAPSSASRIARCSASARRGSRSHSICSPSFRSFGMSLFCIEFACACTLPSFGCFRRIYFHFLISFMRVGIPMHSALPLRAQRELGGGANRVHAIRSNERHRGPVGHHCASHCDGRIGRRHLDDGCVSQCDARTGIVMVDVLSFLFVQSYEFKC